MANQNNNKGGQQQDVNQLLKVRREKLQNLQEAGKDPFQITKYDVTNHTTEIKDNFENRCIQTCSNIKKRITFGWES